MLSEITKQERDKITEAARDALLRLPFHQDFNTLQDFLRIYLDDTRRRGDVMVGHEKEWNQGWCQALQFVLDLPEQVHASRKQ
jgi:hypothetical protein